MRPFASIALLLLALVLAACGGTGASGSPAPASDAPSTAPSVEPSVAPSASADASAAPSASAAGETVEVVGTDYAYSGLQASYTGPITIAFRNDGAEVHEVALVRKNPGVTESFEELLAMPEADSATKVAFVGVAFAGPGETAADQIVADQPGEYLAICFIPQGTTELPSLDPNASEPPDLGTGAPHFTLGMQQEFTIGS